MGLECGMECFCGSSKDAPMSAEGPSSRLRARGTLARFVVDLLL